jgi:hypothetical protein
MFAADTTQGDDDDDDDDGGGDDDDDGDGDDDDGTGDDDDDDPYLPDPTTPCEDCEASSYSDCEESYHAQLSNLVATGSIPLLKGCGVDAVKSIANGDDISFYDVIVCSMEAQEVQDKMDALDQSLGSCMNNVDGGCNFVCG